MEYGTKPIGVPAHLDLVQTIHHGRIEAGFYRDRDDNGDETIVVKIVTLLDGGLFCRDNGFEMSDLAALAEVALEAKRWIEERLETIASHTELAQLAKGELRTKQEG